MALPSKQYKIGFFPGVWDLFHAGHVLALKEAKEHCEILVVGLEVSTEGRYGKNVPIMSAKERKIILESCKYVDAVIPYENEEELYKIDSSVDCQVRFMGSDHKGREHHNIKAPIIYISRNHEYSSSNIREKCRLS